MDRSPGATTSPSQAALNGDRVRTVEGAGSLFLWLHFRGNYVFVSELHILRGLERIWVPLRGPSGETTMGYLCGERDLKAAG